MTFLAAFATRSREAGHSYCSTEVDIDTMSGEDDKKPSLGAVDDIFGKAEQADPTEAMTTDDLRAACKRMDNQKRQLRSRTARVSHDVTKMQAKVADNKKKIKLNMQLPWLVGTVQEVRCFQFSHLATPSARHAWPLNAYACMHLP